MARCPAPQRFSKRRGARLENFPARAELPARTQQVAYSFSNQFELPVLFYVLTILEIITRHADFIFVVLAWVFVAMRLGQAYVHTTSKRRPAPRMFYVVALWC